MLPGNSRDSNEVPSKGGLGIREELGFKVRGGLGTRGKSWGLCSPQMALKQTLCRWP